MREELGEELAEAASMATVTQEEESKESISPDSFPFPFPPYGIQERFMRQLYLTLEGGKIGIFESPTGTVYLTHCLKL